MHRVAEMARTFQKLTEAKVHDFVECLVYSKEQSVIMLGTLVDEAEESKVICHKKLNFILISKSHFKFASQRIRVLQLNPANKSIAK